MKRVTILLRLGLPPRPYTSNYLIRSRNHSPVRVMASGRVRPINHSISSFRGAKGDIAISASGYVDPPHSHEARSNRAAVRLPPVERRRPFTCRETGATLE